MSGALPLRPLGATGISVSAVALGTVKFGRNTDLKYADPFELPSAGQIDALLDTARSEGINLLDTAPAYGDAEARIGRALGAQRADWVICTKTGEEYDGRRSRFDFSAEHTRASVERSLRRLDTDYLDAVLAHCPDEDERVLRETDVIETLQRLRERGLIRAIGASVKTLAGALLASRHCDLIMVTLNANATDMLPALAAARRRGVAVLVKKPLDAGRRGTHADADLRWIAARPAVSSVVLGTLAPGHLSSAAHAVAALGH